MKIRIILVCIVFFGAIGSVSGQLYFKQACLDLTQPYQPLPLNDSNSVHNPKKATILSAIIPGLGQVYNQKYWKVGLIYAAGFGIGYGIKYNTDSLKNYQKALIALLDTFDSTENIWYPSLSVDKIRSERNFYRKNRDRLILGAGLLYALQIIDANVDAHLREFDINKDLAIKPNPGFMVLNRRVQPTLGFSLRF